MNCVRFEVTLEYLVLSSIKIKWGAISHWDGVSNCGGGQGICAYLPRVFSLYVPKPG